MWFLCVHTSAYFISLKVIFSSFYNMSRRRPASPPGPTHIPVDSSSKLRFGDFKKVYDATPLGFIVRYPCLDEPNPSQMAEGSIGILYASFKVGLRFPLPSFAK